MQPISLRCSKHSRQSSCAAVPTASGSSLMAPNKAFLAALKLACGTNNASPSLDHTMRERDDNRWANLLFFHRRFKRCHGLAYLGFQRSIERPCGCRALDDSFEILRGHGDFKVRGQEQRRDGGSCAHPIVQSGVFPLRHGKSGRPSHPHDLIAFFLWVI